MKVYVKEWIKLNETWICFSLDEMCAKDSLAVSVQLEKNGQGI